MIWIWSRHAVKYFFLSLPVNWSQFIIVKNVENYLLVRKVSFLDMIHAICNTQFRSLACYVPNTCYYILWSSEIHSTTHIGKLQAKKKLFFVCMLHFDFMLRFIFSLFSSLLTALNAIHYNSWRERIKHCRAQNCYFHCFALYENVWNSHECVYILEVLYSCNILKFINALYLSLFKV